MSLVPRGVCQKKKYKNKENRANFGSQVCLPKILGLFMDFESESPGDHCRVYIGKFGPQRWLTKKKYFRTIPQSNCVHRESNPNLILGRDKYYPCTMDAWYLYVSRNAYSYLVNCDWTIRKKRIREGRFELPTKGSPRRSIHTLQSSALPLSYPRLLILGHNRPSPNMKQCFSQLTKK